MKATGIIVEYNPLHTGHLYHLQKVKELTEPDVIVAVMSGNFVQRGEFAIIDKWSRTKAAIQAGVNLVIELPFPFVVQSATYFGAHAVDILALAKVSSIVFGSEINNIEELKEIASLNFNIDNFTENMKKGYSYPASYGFMADCYGPNDILAISYLRELEKYPDITPYSIQRTSDYHNDEFTEAYPSALAIRKALINGQSFANTTPLEKELKEFPVITWEKCYGYIRNLILTTSKKDLEKIFLMDEGIENHLQKVAYNCYNWKDFIDQAVTRRYTRSRIQRTLCHLLVNNTKEFMKRLPEYDTIRVLGYDDTGRKYIKELQENGVRIANHYTANIKPYRDLEYKASVAYSMLMDEKWREYISRSEISGLNLEHNGKRKEK